MIVSPAQVDGREACDPVAPIVNSRQRRRNSARVELNCPPRSYDLKKIPPVGTINIVVTGRRRQRPMP